LFGREKKIKINELEVEMFNGLWEIFESHEPKEHFPIPPKQMVDDYVQFLALKYKFDPNNFTIYDNKGKLLHSRVERPKESVN